MPAAIASYSVWRQHDEKLQEQLLQWVIAPEKFGSNQTIAVRMGMAFGLIDQTVSRRKSAAASVAASDTLLVEDTMVAHLSVNVRSQVDFWVKSLDEIVAVTAAAGRERQIAAAAEAGLARTVQISAASVGLLIGGLAAWLISRNVTLPIRRAVSVAKRVAEGDLSEPIESGTKDETGALLGALSHMQSSLHRVVAEVQGSDQSDRGRLGGGGVRQRRSVTAHRTGRRSVAAHERLGHAALRRGAPIG